LAPAAGINPDHVLYFGRKDNFWEMAETGPCGPCSEIHIDRGPEYCDKKGIRGMFVAVKWRLQAFPGIMEPGVHPIQPVGAKHSEPLPATHVDTGMGFERIVSVLQNVSSNYKTTY
jgi:alanyl-tRNA synthetase